MSESPNEAPESSREAVPRGSPFFEFMARNVRAIVIIGLVLTVPITALAAGGSTDEPNFDPSGEIYDTFELVDDVRFQPTDTVNRTIFIVEDPAGKDALTRDVLLEWKTNTDAFREAPPTLEDDDPAHLTTQFDFDLGVEIDGVYSIADAVDEQLREDGLSDGLADDAATDAEVKLALARLLADDSPSAQLRFTLSQLAESGPGTVGDEDIIIWKSPAFISDIVYDFDSFNADGSLDEDEHGLEAERWLREVQSSLRGEQESISAIGVVLDPGLVQEELGEESSPFILLAVVFIVLLVGVLTRSYWASAFVTVGLCLTLLWAGASTTVLGFEGGLLLGFIVPIAVISFGVDFFFHAAGRAREEQLAGLERDRAYPVGLTLVAPALTLAVLSSMAAFASNAVSGVQAILQFGIGAAIALAWAYLFLGLIAPKVLLATETKLGPPPADRGFLRLGHRLGFVLMALVGGAAVTFAVVLPLVGFVAMLVFLLLFVWMPYAVTKKSYAKSAAAGNPVDLELHGAGHGFKAAGAVVHFLARWRVVTLPVTFVLAILGGVAFTQVEAEFSFTDFFPSDSDAIVSLDKLEVHQGESTGGSGFIYLEGDLTDVASLVAIEDAIAVVDSSDAELSREFDDSLVVSQTASSLVRTAVATEASRSAIEESTGVAIGPDLEALTSEEIDAIYQHARTDGLVDAEGLPVFAPSAAQLTVDDLGDGTYATLIEVGIPTLIEDGIILDARGALDEAAAQLEAGPAAGSFAVVSVSGETITSQDSLDQFTDAMLLSLPVAVVLCALLAMVFMRSVKYGITAVIPILLVVGWVYGFMFVADFKINVVTATIAAIAVGVGIDFSTHFTMRFREEFEDEPSRFPALRRAGEGTGGALALSALSSIVGFLIMSRAPMPIFQTFGVLTAVMIFFSAAVALLVLPSLLLLVTPSRKGREREQLEEAATEGSWGYHPHDRETAVRTHHAP